MVQEATSIPEGETSSEDLGDQPLIAEEPRTDLLIKPGTEGELNDAGAGSESTEDVEQPEAGAAAEPEAPSQDEPEAEESQEEQPEAEAESEESEREPRTYTAEEWSRREASYGRQITDRDKQISDLTNRIGSLEQQTSQQAFQAQVEGVRKQFADGLLQQNPTMDEANAQSYANQFVNLAQRAYELNEQVRRLEAEKADVFSKNEQISRSTLADRLLREHNLTDEDRDILLGYETQENMERAAKRLGQLTRDRRQRAEERRKEVPASGPEQEYDAGEGQSGMTDMQKLADPNTPVAELRRIMKKQGVPV